MVFAFKFHDRWVDICFLFFSPYLHRAFSNPLLYEEGLDFWFDRFNAKFIFIHIFTTSPSFIFMRFRFLSFSSLTFLSHPYLPWLHPMIWSIPMRSYWIHYYRQTSPLLLLSLRSLPCLPIHRILVIWWIRITYERSLWSTTIRSIAMLSYC